MQGRADANRILSSWTLLPSPVFLRISTNNSERYKCRSCDLEFRSLSELKIHEIITEKRIKCSICKESFETVLGMKKHYGKLHAKYRPSRCSTCKKRFRNKYAAKRHYSQVHQESSRISCINCGKILYNKFSLSRHSKICKQ